ncbi:CPBP family intramembrane glutamic endopeptidase [uncultured Subdoligranulum sp.]|uniref:CPBP family intramembrane glutamic endopeptidase n=1 Tax=uncultured Subdoligranulum sp. TaxID=512298 RepID=UPI0025FA5EC7|nr:CPBP family intramembrane glutamic endopeptidase [uncultured Subdoligranulum sp.]
MKLWQGVVLGVVYLFAGYLVAVCLGIPRDVRSLLFVSVLTLVLAVVLLGIAPPSNWRALFRVRKPLLGWTLVLLAAQLLVMQISVVLGVWFASDKVSSTFLNGPMPFQMLAIALLGPINEELIFRGGLTQGLCARIHWKAGIVIPAVLFVLCHYWTQIPQTLIFGLLLGYLCWYTGSIAYGIILHVLFNASAFLNFSGYPLLVWNPAVGTVLLLLISAAGLALTLWALRGFTRCADRLAAQA